MPTWRDLLAVAAVALLFGVTGWGLSRCAPGDYITRLPTTSTSAP